MSVLYVVSTPIGNLSDLSDRAKDLFNSIEYVIAEDTRVSKKLFMENKKKVTIISVHSFPLYDLNAVHRLHTAKLPLQVFFLAKLMIL